MVNPSHPPQPPLHAKPKIGVASHEGRVLVMTTNRPEKLDEALIRPGRVDLQVPFGNATQTQVEELFKRMYTNDVPRAKYVKSASTITSPVQNEKLAAIKEKVGVPTPPRTPVTAEHPDGHALCSKSDDSALSFNGYSKINGAILNPEKETGEVEEEELMDIARDFSLKIPNDVFSPAEIQGFLLKRKKDPRRALLEIEAWVEGMMEVKRKGTKLVNVQ